MGGEVNAKRNSIHEGVPKEAGTKNLNANSFIQEGGNAGLQKKLKWLHQKTRKQHRTTFLSPQLPQQKPCVL